MRLKFSKRHLFVSLVLFGAVTDLYAFSDEAPELNMVVFEDDSHFVPESHKSQVAMADDSSFQMVVFSDQMQASDPEVRETFEQNNRDGEFSFYYEVSTGYQHDELDWSVASPTVTGDPNPVLEMNWKNIDMWRIRGSFDMEMPIGIVLNGYVQYGRVLNGDGTQTAYAGSNRTLPYSVIQGNTDGGYQLGGILGAGYRLSTNFGPVTTSVTPMAGYAYDQLELTLSGDVNNKYKAEWSGPWLGAEGKLGWRGMHELFASFRHHWADYEADADWKQTDALAQPLSFRHKSEATGWQGWFGYRYHTGDIWGMSLTFDYQKWNGEQGTENAFLANEVEVVSPLNEVNRESLGVNLGINMKF